MNFQRPDDHTRLDPRRPTAAETARWRRQSLWRNLILWRVIALISLLAAIAAVAALELRPAAEPPEQLVASLGPPDLIDPYVVTVEPKLGILRAPGQPAPDPTRIAALWLQFHGEAPIHLGMLDPSRPVRVRLPDAALKRLDESPEVFVTLEKLDGRQHATPESPVVARGTINPL
jgi:anti-sigma-K factor RskA